MEHSGNKKARIELPVPNRSLLVKQESLDQETTPVAQVVMKFDQSLLTVRLPALPLAIATSRVPGTIDHILQCPAKHMACGSFAASNQLNRCEMCTGGGGAYERNDGLDPFLLGAKVSCPNAVYGCQISVAYCLVADHKLVCPHAPCNCPKPGCVFLGSPPMLYGHLKSQHKWLVTPITYGKCILLEMQPTERRRLLAAEDGEGLFLLVVSVGSGRGRDVKVVCVRASEDAGQSCYWCNVWTDTPEDAVTGKKPVVMYEDRARCCGVLSEDAAMDVGGKYVHVPFEDTRPGEGLGLRVRIEKVQFFQATPSPSNNTAAAGATAASPLRS